jgi:multiple sugar transport system substrate-binding protein
MKQSTSRTQLRSGPVGRSAATFAIAASLVTFGAASPAGASRVPRASHGSATGVVTYWDRAGFALPPALVKEFNKTHPNLKVEFTPVNTTIEPTKLATAIRAGTAPDLVGIDDIEIGQFINEGVMENVTSQLRSMSAFKSLNKGQLRSVSYPGGYYGFPEYADLSVLYWNKTLFKKAGLNPNAAPSNFAEILADAKKVSALGHGTYGFTFAGECPGCENFTMLPDVWATGQDVVKGSVTHQVPTVENNAPLKALLTLYHELWADKLVPPSDKTDTGTTWGNNFKAGNVGIAPNSYDFATTLAQAHVKFQWGMTTLPGPDGGYSTFDGGADFGIPKGAKNAAGALEFVNWVLQKSQQLQFPTYGLTPVRTDILTPSYRAKYPLDAIALKALAHGNLTVGPAATQIYHPLNGAWQAMFDLAVYQGQIVKALKTGQSMYTQEIASA